MIFLIRVIYSTILVVLPWLTFNNPAFSKNDTNIEQNENDSFKGLTSYEIIDKANKELNDARYKEINGNIKGAIINYRNALRGFQLANVDTMVIQVFGDIGICFWEMGDFEMANRNLQSQLHWIDSTQNTNYLPICYNNIGLVYYYSHDFNNAIKYYSLAIQEFRHLKDSNSLATSLLNLGILLKNQGLYEEALKLLFESESYLRSQEENRPLASCNEAIGHIYFRIGELVNSKHNHWAALRIRTELGYQKGIAKSLNNLGLVYLEMKQYDSALVFLDSSLTIKIAIGNKKLIASTYENIGKVYQHKGILTQAKEYYKRGITLSKSINHPSQIVSFYHLLGRIDLKLGQYSLAQKSLDSASSWLKLLESLPLLMEHFNAWNAYYSAVGDHQQALEYLNQYIKLKDSILNAENHNHINQLRIIYEVEKKEKENTILRQEVEVDRIKFYLLTAIIILFLILLLISINVIRLKKKTADKEKLLRKEMDHRTRNNLQLLSAFLELQVDNLDDQNAIEAVNSSKGRINAMSVIHKNLSPVDRQEKINTEDFLSDLINQVHQSMDTDKLKVSIDIQIQHPDLHADKAVSIGLILNELMTNAYKHAYKNVRHPKLTIAFYRTEKNSILTIHDNGNSEFNSFAEKPVESFGIRLISLLTKQLNGHYSLEFNQGTRFTLTI